MRSLIARYANLLILGMMAPVEASAQTTSVSEVVGLFNIVVGFMFSAAFVTFLGGFVSYLVHFGNQERAVGVKTMEWGVSILFVLVILLGGAQFFQGHQGVTNVIAALVVMIGVAWVLFTVMTEKTEPPKEEKKP